LSSVLNEAFGYGAGVSARVEEARARLVDTTMLYAPKSGGVKRYLTAKRDWLRANRPQVDHSLIVPGEADAYDGEGIWSVYTVIPFGDGYRLPTSAAAWRRRLIQQQPDLIEAGDPFAPGMAALQAGQAVGCPVIGFCHTDMGALAGLHIGEWAERPIRRQWAKLYDRFDHVLTPSRYMAERLRAEGVETVTAMPLGVDIDTFSPDRADRDAVRRTLGLRPDQKLLVFAGRPAREKRLEILVEAVEQLGDDYVLLLVGAGEGAPASDRLRCWPYEKRPADLARVLSSCDAFVHANGAEPFGLIVLEAMACGLPVVGPSIGGIAETVDETVGVLATSQTGAAFAEAIEALFARDLDAVGAEARKRAVARHRWDVVFERLADIYAATTGRRGFLPA
jgi:alpha-1,6-mannosyltransferase